MSKANPALPRGWRGVLLALGIVFGDIGTSPLYVLDALCRGEVISEEVVMGGVSLIFWVMTLLVTVKYVVFVLRADNHGEGGIFALYALLRGVAPGVMPLVILAAAMSFADSIFTPAISVTSAVEGFQLHMQSIAVVPIVLIIITGLFFIQQFGTEWVGRFFGPVTLIWFVFIASMGAFHIWENPLILQALNPWYAWHFLAEHPGGLLLLGAVFLTATGVEALYADLGHVGRSSIRRAWALVKPALLLSYFGQGAWLLTYKRGLQLGAFEKPFYAMLPEGWLLGGVAIATLATIIASQATISGAYTIFSEAMRLGFWPRMRILYPAITRGQMYVPFINWSLWSIIVIVVLTMQRSSAMEAAYGTAINIVMLTTTVLFSTLLLYRYRAKMASQLPFFIFVFGPIELLFLYANLHKVSEGGWVALLVGGLVIVVMGIWTLGERIKRRFSDLVDINPYIARIRALRSDPTVPYYAAHLACLTISPAPQKLEHRLLYALLQRQPKRAHTYWFLHVHVTDSPFEATYTLHTYEKGYLYRVDFYIGYKLQPPLSLLLRQVIETLTQKGELDILSPYPSLRQFGQPGDFRFLMVRRLFNFDPRFSPSTRFFLQLYNFFDRVSLSAEAVYGLELASVAREYIPLTTPTIPPELRLRLRD